MMAVNDFHPDLRRLARFLPRTLVTARTLPLVRAGVLTQRPRVKPTEVLKLTGGVGIRLFRPHTVSDPSAALLWIHGGGYVLDLARWDDPLCRRFANHLGVIVASVEYRLAPEHPFPAPLEDCYSALKWLASLPSVDADRVAIGGASAGGGLTAALALLARDRGEITPAFQLLTYPMIDDRTLPSSSVERNYRVWSARSNRVGWTSYLGGADPAVAVPSRREDLKGLPPAWVGVGTLDLFYDEDIAYAARLKDAGVPCEVEVVPGAFHGFDLVAPGAGVSRAFFGRQCAALRGALMPSTAA
jgi:acetyl esterase/lipase